MQIKWWYEWKGEVVNKNSEAVISVKQKDQSVGQGAISVQGKEIFP